MKVWLRNWLRAYGAEIAASQEMDRLMGIGRGPDAAGAIGAFIDAVHRRGDHVDY